MRADMARRPQRAVLWPFVVPSVEAIHGLLDRLTAARKIRRHRAIEGTEEMEHAGMDRHMLLLGRMHLVGGPCWPTKEVFHLAHLAPGRQTPVAVGHTDMQPAAAIRLDARGQEDQHTAQGAIGATVLRTHAKGRWDRPPPRWRGRGNPGAREFQRCGGAIAEGIDAPLPGYRCHAHLPQARIRLGSGSRNNSVYAQVRASSRSGDAMPGTQVTSCSSSSGHTPTRWARWRSNRALTGSARVCLPRLACTCL